MNTTNSKKIIRRDIMPAEKDSTKKEKNIGKK